MDFISDWLIGWLISAVHQTFNHKNFNTHHMCTQSLAATQSDPEVLNLGSTKLKDVPYRLQRSTFTPMSQLVM